MNEFNYEKLESLTSRIKVGFVGSVNEFYCEPNIGVPIIRTTDIDDIDFEKVKYVTKEFHIKNKKSQLKKGDLIIARHGNNGNAVIYQHTKNAQVLNAVIIEPDQNKISSELLKIYFDSPFIKRQILGSVKGSVQGVINTKHISELILNIGSSINYDFVTRIITNINKKVGLNNKINDELEAMSKLIYDYWFVQFDFPDANGKPYKSSGGKMVFNKELKREIPDDWEVNELAAISNITTGKLDSNAEVLGGYFPFFTCSKEPTTIDNYSFDDDVILIAGNNAQGNFHVNRYSGKFNAYQRTYIVTAKKSKHLNYLYQVLKYQMKVYKSQGKGSQTKFLTIGMLTEIQTFEPNFDLISEYEKATKHLYEKQINIVNENKELESLRDWLLPLLMNGQVTVKEA